MLHSSYRLTHRVEWGWIAPQNERENPLAEVKALVPVQTHSDNIAFVTANDKGPYEDTDAIITQVRGLTIGIRTADCVPILLYAPDIAAVAAVHAGWKGTLNGIVTKTVDKLVEMGAFPSAMSAVIGNCICATCYEISKELASEFVGREEFAESVTCGEYSDPLSRVRFDKDRPHLNLVGANRALLVEAGIPESNITCTGICTRHTLIGSDSPSCGGGYFPSWRRDSGTTLRQLTWIRLD